MILQNGLFLHFHMSRIVRKPAFCICKNKVADQLRSSRKADQHLYFHYTDRTIPLLPKSEISMLLPSSVTVQTGLCGTWSETPKTGFLITRLILLSIELTLLGKERAYLIAITALHLYKVDTGDWL